tara:strand:- start:4985 stop:5179 length:195 start_codon:yes stop_codon:yes gene_type:complete
MNEIFVRVDENGIISFGGMCKVSELPNQFDKLRKLLDDSEEDLEEEIKEQPKKKGFSLSLGKKK